MPVTHLDETAYEEPLLGLGPVRFRDEKNQVIALRNPKSVRAIEALACALTSAFPLLINKLDKELYFILGEGFFLLRHFLSQ